MPSQQGHMSSSPHIESIEEVSEWKRRREGEEERGTDSRGTSQSSIKKRLDYRLSRGKGGMNYMEMKRVRHREREGGREGGWGTRERVRQQQEATERETREISIAVILEAERAHQHLPDERQRVILIQGGRYTGRGKTGKTCHCGHG